MNRLMIRKTGLLLVVIVPVVAVAWAYVARNAIVTGIATLALERMLGTEVQLEGVDVNLRAASAGFRRLRIVDKDAPSRFLLVAGPATFRMNGPQLFARKLVIEEMSVAGLALDQPRPGYTAPPKPPPAAAPAAGGSSGGAGGKPDDTKTENGGLGLDIPLPKLNLDALEQELDVGRVTSGQKLASLQALDQAEADAKARIDSLRQRSDKLDAQARLDAIRAKVKALDFKSRDPRVLKASLKGLQEAIAEAKALNAETTALARDLRAEPGRLKADYKRVDTELDADVAAALRLADLGDLDLQRAGMLLFGQPVLERFNWVMARFRQVRGMLASDKAKNEAVPRRAGRLIAFPVTGRVYPGFLAERIAFKGAVNDAAGQATREFSGTLLGLNSNARVYGKPTLLLATATGTAGERWTIRGDFDHRQEPATDTLLAKGEGVKLDDVRLSGGSWPQKAVSKSADVALSAALRLDALQGSLKVDARNVHFVFADGAQPGALKRDLFADLDSVEVKADLGGTLRSPKLRVSSSLDELFSRRLKGLVAKRREEAAKRIRARIEQQVAARRAELERTLAERRGSLEADLKATQAKVDALQQELADRQQAAQQKLAGAGDAAKDKAAQQAKQKAADALRKLRRR